MDCGGGLEWKKKGGELGLQNKRSQMPWYSYDTKQTTTTTSGQEVFKYHGVGLGQEIFEKSRVGSGHPDLI